MKKTILLCLFALALSNVNAQDKAEKPAAGKNPNAEQEMKMWMTYMTPAEMHKMLEASSGTWQEQITFWEAPGAPPQEMKSSCTNEMILGGRYQQSKHNGEMMGMPFEGIGLTGYDNAKKVFQSTWVDNMGTGIMYSEGKYDAPTKSITFRGKAVDPMTGKEHQVRQVFKMISENEQEMDMYMTKDAKEFKNMHIKMTR
jgi:hypothetical protein